MSQYVNIYLNKNNTWIMIAEYSRSTKHYEIIHNHVSYGELTYLTKDIINSAYTDISDELENIAKSKQRHLDEIRLIAGMPNSVEEKMESIADNQNYLEWCDEEIRSLTAVRFFLTFINDIISIAESYENSCYTIWAGVESYPPNEEEDT